MNRARAAVLAVGCGALILLLGGCFLFGNRSPVARFAIVYGTGTSVDFDGSASSDSDGTIVSYAWRFGDGQTDSGIAVTHIYPVQSESRIYTVVLTIQDNDAASDTAADDVTIAPIP